MLPLKHRVCYLIASIIYDLNNTLCLCTFLLNLLNKFYSHFIIWLTLQISPKSYTIIRSTNGSVALEEQQDRMIQL